MVSFWYTYVAALALLLTGCVSSRTLAPDRTCSDLNALLHEESFVVMFKDGERVVGEGITLEPGFAVFERLHRRKNQRVPVEDIDYVIVREGVRTGTAVGGVIAAGGVVSLSLAESSNSLPEAVGYWKLGLVGLGIGGVVALLSEAHKPRQAYVLEGCQDIGSMGWYENN